MKVRFLTTILIIFSVTASCQKILNLPAKDAGGWVPPPDSSNYEFYYFFSGQSNCNGRQSLAGLTSTNPEMTGLMHVGEDTAFIRQYSYTDNTTFYQLNAAYNTGTGTDGSRRIGPETSFAWDMLNYEGHDVYIVKLAIDGQSINNWEEGDTYWEWLESTKGEIDIDCAARGKIPIYVSFYWMQGESDGATAGTYETRLRDLASRVHALMGNSCLFMVSQLTDAQVGVTNLSTIQAAQATVGGESYNYLLPKSIGDQTSGDGLHYPGIRYVQMGQYAAGVVKNIY